jgi:hypothetical protein
MLIINPKGQVRKLSDKEIKYEGWGHSLVAERLPNALQTHKQTKKRNEVCLSMSVKVTDLNSKQ